MSEATKQWRKENPDKANAVYRRYRARLKREVVEGYGGACACCGETEMAFLTLDHVGNDGAEHKRELGITSGGSAKLYRLVRDQGFPSRFQILCQNCNFGKAVNGGVCPHQRPLVYDEARRDPQRGECGEEGCDRKHYAKGKCEKHYRAKRRAKAGLDPVAL